MSSLPVILKVILLQNVNALALLDFKYIGRVHTHPNLPKKDSHKKLIAVMCVSEYDQNFVATEFHSHVMMISKVLL